MDDACSLEAVLLEQVAAEGQTPLFYDAEVRVGEARSSQRDLVFGSRWQV